MRHLPTIVALAALAGMASAQELVWRVTGTTPSGVTGGRQLGYRTSAVGDLNHDGYEDVMTIAYGACGSYGPFFLGYLWLLSGLDGTLMREVSTPYSVTPPMVYSIRSIAAVGDMNGDGTPDYALGMIDQVGLVNHRVDVRSGVDDSIIWTTPTFWPNQLIGGLDVDGDGANDVVVCDHVVNGYYGRADVYSSSGQILYSLNGATQSPPRTIGLCLASLGDIDDDGADDFVMGAAAANQRGAALIFSGRTGNLIRECNGLPGEFLQETVDNCGDIDLDGYADLVVSSGLLTQPSVRAIRVFSSRSGQNLMSWVTPVSNGSGAVISSRGVDFDGDGFADVLRGNSELVSPQQRGAVYVLSGRDGSQIHRVISTPQSGGGRIGTWMTTLKAPVAERIGSFVVPDVDAFFWSAPTPGCAYTLGAISVYRGLPQTTQVIGPACAGNLLNPPHIGLQSIAGGVRVHLADAPPNVAAVALLGLSTTQWFGVSLPAALDPLGLPGCSLRTSIELMQLAVTGSGAVPPGYASVDVPLPVPASGTGTWSVSAQWLVLGDANTFPGGVSEAITWRR